jgi:hypothetical protein
VGSGNHKHPGYKYCLPYRDFGLGEQVWSALHIRHRGSWEQFGNFAALTTEASLHSSEAYCEANTLGFDYLHRDCYLIHSGDILYQARLQALRNPSADLKADNIFVSLEGTATDIEHELEVNPSQT